ncbi:hypothetical protein AAG570_000726 [Ranatra chinensis]|uniref:ABC transporter domain-containing protein n=1 Tax=Ranatra chinensis TaxID=642074 RepID=A0ABD0ZJ39_9HEMI
MTEDNEAKNQYMLKIVGGRLKFGNDEILSGLNMNVPKGKMYTLLGSSGCGKTTLLNCIVHANKLDSGRIYRQWRSFSEIGYMPQEVKKTVEKWLSEVEWNAFDGSIKKLVPRLKKCIEVDGDNVKTYFEIHPANVVGMMRKGVMVAEDTPSALMERFEGSSLEKTFLQLSALQEEQPPLLSQDSALDSLRTVKQWDAQLQVLKHVGFRGQSLEVLSLPEYTALCRMGVQRFASLVGSIFRESLHPAFAWNAVSRFTPEDSALLKLQTSIGAIPNHIQLGVINDELYGNSGKCSPEMNSPSCSDNGLLSCYYIHRVKSKFDLINTGVEGLMVNLLTAFLQTTDAGCGFSLKILSALEVKLPFVTTWSTPKDSAL